MSTRVIIAGGTGFLGTALRKLLEKDGNYTVQVISRSASRLQTSSNKEETKGSEAIIPWPTADHCLPPCDAIVQLAGAGIMDARWTDARKKELVDSRVGTSKLLLQHLNPTPPSTFIQTSAVGIYPTSDGTSANEVAWHEDDPLPLNSSSSGNDNDGSSNYDSLPFQQRLCHEWEDVLLKHKSETVQKMRKVVVRTGVVLAGEGGPLREMAPAWRMCLGAQLARGLQHFPFIHLADYSLLLKFAIDNSSVHGILNGVAPEPCTNYEFTKALGAALNRPAVLAVPGFVLKMALGERSVLLLEGQKVLPKRPLAYNFKYSYPTINKALQNIFAAK